MRAYYVRLADYPDRKTMHKMISKRECASVSESARACRDECACTRICTHTVHREHSKRCRCRRRRWHQCCAFVYDNDDDDETEPSAFVRLCVCVQCVCVNRSDLLLVQVYLDAFIYKLPQRWNTSSGHRVSADVVDELEEGNFVSLSR